MIQPVILCGGSGTRLWPRSRASRPKPFLALTGETSLFEATLARVSDREMFAPPIVVTGQQHVELVLAQAGDVDGLRIVVEPVGRNTAPAIALAACILPEDAVMLVCPSDHHIADIAEFIRSARDGAVLASDGWLTAIGVKASRPETGYGYILEGEGIAAPCKKSCHTIERFVEKPDAALAAEFLADGRYCWNAGIFAFGAANFLAELARHRPDMAEMAQQAMAASAADGVLIKPDTAIFSSIEPESVDYAVMEQARRAAVVAADMGWSDIGNWRALRDARVHDANGNSIKGSADLVDCHDVMVDSDGPHVSVIGLDDVIVVVDGDEILVVSASGAQKVGKLPGVTGA